MVTGWLQSLYYNITIRAGAPKPQPGSPKYIAHRRRIHILVVSAYLLYTIYEADYDIRRASDFYQDLSLPVSATDREIKSRFRRLAAVHHPDKDPNSANYFVHLKLAQDTLLNPAKRFAYERFGPSMLEWQRCSSTRDYVLHGLQSILPYYGAAALGMYILSLLGYMDWGKYWRWVTLICLCVFELHAISRPYFPAVASKVVNPVLTTFTRHPPYLPFQMIALAKKCSLTLYIAFSQIGPLLQPTSAQAQGQQNVDMQLQRLENTAKATDVEVSRLMAMEMSPFVGDEQALNGVKGKVRDWLVQNTIRSDPEVRDALGNLLKRRRNAPAGARGNR